MKALEVRDLKKTYKDKVAGKAVEALKGVSFSIEAGSIFGLLGPNGAGKTTLISSIITLEKPTSGELFVFGDSVLKQPLKTKMNVGVVHQEVINTGFFTIEEILGFQSGYYGILKNKERCDYLMQKLSLWEHRRKKVKQLSGGMKRRLMIAKALVHSPKLLLLDEPTAGVDVSLRESLWDFVHELKAEGISILLTTHYLEEAERMCDRVAIINKGTVLFNGTPQDMIAEYSNKKMVLMMKNGEVREFIESNRLGISELLMKHQINLSDIQDIKIEEGRLENAFSKMVAQ
ncbi:ABC transporter ATP-binding protein [Pseudobdellovibrio exovorus]|uniref:Putative ATP-binding component of a transport system n=1 Tax=Pseudobdellovibrio exovorus JSS TaxID=1184267 RepID=M4V7W5_9BACT|nr:ABC transporter ATP-binding protein [Pseudobdellovibrio exovorus]AGH95467.1 putative ATP-binding component of a transport system [Pseudobdellovibrio exovorus JSS]